MTADRSLPNGWRWVRFGDVVREVRAATRDPEAEGLTRVVGLDHLDSDSLQLRRWSEIADLSDGTSFTRVFRAGQLLFGKRRAYQRKVAVPDFDGICSSDILVFEPNAHDLLVDFLPYVVQSDGFFDHALGTSAGSLSPRTKWQELARYEFALPPLEYQSAAAQVLHAAADVRTGYESVLNESKMVREALLAELVLRCSEDFVQLGEVAVVVSGESWSGSDETKASEPNAVPVIGISALKSDGSIDTSNETYVRGLGAKNSLFLTDAMTVVAIRTNGNADRIGNVYRLTDEHEGRALSAFTFGCRFREAATRDLAFEFMRGRQFQAWATALVAGSTGLKNLPIRELRQLRVPTVRSRFERSSLERLSALRESEAAASRSLAAAERVERTLRERLLGGDDNVQ